MTTSMSSEELDRHAAELAEKLGGKVSQETLREELDKYVFKYQISIESARSGILKKYSSPKSAEGAQAMPVSKRIQELRGDEMNVNVTAKIVFVEKKDISTKNGDKTIISGMIDDGSASAPFTIWSDEGEFEKGKVYTFKRAYCKKFRDQVQLNIGSRGSVEPSDVQIEGSSWVPAKAENMKIRDITESTKSASIVGKVLSVEPRYVNLRGEDRTVWGGTIDDGTGKIQFSAWENVGFTVGKVYSIENAGIRTWRGIPQINIGNYTTVSESDAVIEVKEEVARTVLDIARSGGGIDITVSGLIVDIKQGSGLIKRCPECKRALSSTGECSVHRMVAEPVSDLRLKTILDDGTGAISVIIGRRDTEALTGITLERAEEMVRGSNPPSSVLDEMSSKMLLRRISVSGNVMIDESFGPQMSARTAKEVVSDPEAAAEALRIEVEESI